MEDPVDEGAAHSVSIKANTCRADFSEKPNAENPVGEGAAHCVSIKSNTCRADTYKVGDRVKIIGSSASRRGYYEDGKGSGEVIRLMGEEIIVLLDNHGGSCYDAFLAKELLQQ